MVRTVRDFKNMLNQRVGASYHPSGFIERSEQHMRFWHKLNTIGARRIRELPPEKVPDIDATVTLSDEEWRRLERELEQLL